MAECCVLVIGKRSVPAGAPLFFILVPSAAAHIPAAGLKLGHISCILSFLCPRGLQLGRLLMKGVQTSLFLYINAYFFADL